MSRAGSQIGCLVGVAGCIRELVRANATQSQTSMHGPAERISSEGMMLSRSPGQFGVGTLRHSTSRSHAVADDRLTRDPCGGGVTGNSYRMAP